MPELDLGKGIKQKNYKKKKCRGERIIENIIQRKKAWKRTQSRKTLEGKESRGKILTEKERSKKIGRNEEPREKTNGTKSPEWSFKRKKDSREKKSSENNEVSNLETQESREALRT